MATAKAPAHPRGLPQVLFIEDEDTFLRETQLTPEEAALEVPAPQPPAGWLTLTRCNPTQMRQAFEQLRMIRDNLAARKEALLEKIPEHDKALQIVRHLRDATDDTHVRFELTGGIYSKARIAPAGKVALWLGANVMLEFTLDEADAFLSKATLEAQAALAIAIEDLQHIDDQQNTLEVNINRMHNFSVQRRKRAMMEQQQQQQLQQQQQPLEAQLKDTKI